MARRKVVVAKTHKESEAKLADEYFRQWQQAKEQLADSEEQVRDLQEQLANCRAEYRADYELQEQTIAKLRNEIGKSYLAGMEQLKRCAVDRIQSWVADNVAITGFDSIYTRLVNAVVWAVEAKTVDNSEPAD